MCITVIDESINIGEKKITKHLHKKFTNINWLKIDVCMHVWPLESTSSPLHHKYSCIIVYFKIWK